MQRNVSVVENLNGNKIVFIHDIRFKGRQAIEWEDVEMYLYDIMNIKKKRVPISSHKDLTQSKTRFFLS